jgi:hypothetical protein
MIVACIATAATFFVSGSLNASLMTYSDFNSWNSHVTNVASEVIPEPAFPSTHMQFLPGYELEVGNAIVSQPGSSGNPLFLQIGSASYGVPAFLSSRTALDATGVTNFQIDFSHDLNGFAINFGTEKASTVSFQLFNSSGGSVDQFSVLSTGGIFYNTANFVGVTDTPFTRIQITTTDHYLNVNNLYDASSFNPPSNAPEPSTLALLSLGGIGLAVSAIRRRKLAKK